MKKKIDENVKIRVFDVQTAVQKEVYDGKKLDTYGAYSNKMGMIEFNDGSSFIFDQELVGSLNMDDVLTVQIHVKELGSMKLMPMGSITLSKEDFIKEIDELEPESIKEFMGSRYNYNGRLGNNLYNTLELIRKRGGIRK